MGTYCTAADVKAFTTSPLLKALDDKVIEMRYIVPAEREIQKVFGLFIPALDVFPWLSITKPDVPLHLLGIFNQFPAKEAEWREDYKAAVIMAAERWSVNPDAFSSHGTRSGSVAFGSILPNEVYNYMDRWANRSERHRVVRG